MLEHNNLDLTQQMIADHHERLRASHRPRLHRMATREPGRLRVSCGQVLIELGERLRGAQVAREEIRPVHLALVD